MGDPSLSKFTHVYLCMFPCTCMHAYIHVHVSSCNKELHFVAASCGEEVISLEAKHKADSLTPGYQLIMHAQISSDLNLYCEINVP